MTFLASNIAPEQPQQPSTWVTRMRKAATEYKKKPTPVFSSDSEEDDQNTEVQTKLLCQPYVPQRVTNTKKST